MILIYQEENRYMARGDFNLIANCNLVIQVNKANNSISILKNRWGGNYRDLPIELLPKIVANPQGKLDWV